MVCWCDFGALSTIASRRSRGALSFLRGGAAPPHLGTIGRGDPGTVVGRTVGVREWNKFMCTLVVFDRRELVVIRISVLLCFAVCHLLAIVLHSVIIDFAWPPASNLYFAFA